MRENYFTKLIKYINIVYHIDKQIGHVTDNRINPMYNTAQVISLVLIGFLLRITSFNQLSLMIKAGKFNSIFGNKDRIPKIDVIRNSLKSVSVQLFKVRRLKNHVPVQKELIRLLLKGLYFSVGYENQILDTG